MQMTETAPSLPVLYSFRRCPYAMRTRLTLKYSQISVELREVKLSQKPNDLLALSAKGTVPVLALTDGSVLDESLDIIQWALSKRDLDNWKLAGQPRFCKDAIELITQNDGKFKNNLDRYKYADRYPDYPAIYYRQAGERFIQELDHRLSIHPYLVCEQLSIADIAVLPFVRQFAHVDRNWFFNSEHKNVINWTLKLMETPLFQFIMKKQKPWNSGDEPTVF